MKCPNCGASITTHTKQCEYYHWQSVVVLGNLSTVNQTCAGFAVFVKYAANEQRYESQTYVLNPEYESVCRAYQFLRYDLGYAGPHG